MSSFELTDQQEDLVNQICKWFHDYESGHRIRNHPQWFSYSGAAGTGKAIPDDELIPTPVGVRYAKDIRVGDYLFGIDGKPTKVCGVYPQPKDTIYKITFSDGRTARCSINHLWPIYLSPSHKNYKVLKLEDFIDNYKGISIPAPEKCEFIYRPIDDDPYHAGRKLGLEIFMNMNFSTLYKRDNFNMNYIINTSNIRYEYIQGIMDICGEYDNRNNNIYFNTRSERIYKMFAFIIRSLGYCASMTFINNIYKVKIHCPDWEKPFLFRLNPIGKLVKYNKSYSKNEFTRLKIILIEEEDAGDLRCFKVDSRDHLFLTSNFVPTHNTTVVNSVIDALKLSDDQFITTAYTGKAALNLQQHGLPACTVHSLIYHTILQKELSTDDEITNGEPEYKMRFHFILKESLPSNYRLIIVDEATMINNDMRDKILSFGIPTIFVGDMNQLPPIFGVSDVMMNPDFVLTQIMRQSEGNPIVQLANLILNDEYYDLGTYGDSKVVTEVDYDRSLLTDYDMSLCGKNKTRDNLNSRIMLDILKRKNIIPFIGAKVVNRQNNWSYAVNGISLTNGLVGFITNISKKTSYKGYYTIDFRPDFIDDEFEDLHIDCKYIQSDYEIRKNFGLTKFEKFEYAYCITTHISQGSQYNRVLFFDEAFPDAETTKKLRYTAITRAIDNITIVRSPTNYFNRQCGWNSEEYNSYRSKYH